MELRQYAAIIWRWLWLIVLATGVAAVGAYLSTRNVPPVYRTKTTLIVGQVIEQTNPSNTDFWTGQQLARTYAELAKREPVLRGTAEALGLNVPWESLAGLVSVKVVEGTQLIEIRVIDSDPTRAQALANEVAHQLILQSPTTPSAEEQERRAFMQAQVSELQNQIKEAQAQIKDLEKELAVATSARQMQDLQGRIAALRNQIQGWQANYTQLVNLLNAGRVNYLSVVEPATSSVQVGPRTMQNVMLAAAVGLVLAVGAAFLIEYLDDTIKTPEDIARTASLPMLGAISRIGGEDYPDKLVAVKHPLSPVVEAYRVLRTNLQFSSLDRPARTLMVTSPGPTEGKSITLANLAVVMAQAGHKVVVVDTDLRRPVQHKIFGLPNTDGLSGAILQPNPGVIEHLKPTGVENLWLLPSGPLPPNPAEVLGSERMGAIVEQLKEYADVVLFDSPPSLVVADAAILGARVDGVLMVNDAGSTRRNEARRAVEELQRVHTNILGVVLNRLSSRRGGYYYYRYYYYYRSADGERKKRRRRHWRSWLERRLFPRRRSAEESD